MANTAGSVLAGYVGMLGGTDIVQQNYFALHMLSQSLMSAPAAIVVSKVLFPQTHGELISKDLTVPKEKLGDNFLDALSLGTTDGLKLAVNVGAMLVVYTAIVWVVNGMMGWIGDITHINAQIATATGGRYDTLSLQMMLGYLFSPVAWLIGVTQVDMIPVGQLLGEKTILNEFVAYISLYEDQWSNCRSKIFIDCNLCPQWFCQLCFYRDSNRGYQPTGSQPTAQSYRAGCKSIDRRHYCLSDVRLHCRCVVWIKQISFTTKLHQLTTKKLFYPFYYQNQG
jgi:nucleoside permease NupC